MVDHDLRPTEVKQDQQNVKAGDIANTNYRQETKKHKVMHSSGSKSHKKNSEKSSKLHKRMLVQEDGRKVRKTLDKKVIVPTVTKGRQHRKHTKLM